MAGAPYSVTEVALTARCPRQMVLARAGYRVQIQGESGGKVGRTAHKIAERMVVAARSSPRLAALLAAPEPPVEPLHEHLYGAVLGDLHDALVALAPASTAVDLARLDGVVRCLARLLAALLVRARRRGVDAAEVAGRVLAATEQEVALDLGDGRVVGRLDLVCEDVETGRRWLWELKTFPADGDPAGPAQAALYALALEGAASPALSPAVLHVTGDRLEMVRAPALGREEAAARVRAMDRWLAGTAVPPKAEHPRWCERCSVQAPCWARWGRTLGEPRDAGAAGGPQAPPEPRAPAPRAPAVPSAPPPAAAPSLRIGEARDGAPIALPASVLTRHVAAIGTTGSGKTWLAKVILEEAALAGVPALVLDVQGDLVQLLAPRARAALPEALRARRDRFAETVEVRVWTPGSDVGRRVSSSPLIVPPADLPDDKLAFSAHAVAEAVVGLFRTAPAVREHAVHAVAEIVARAARRGTALDFEALAEAVREDEDLKPAHRDQLARDLLLLTKGKNKILYQQGQPLRVEDLLAASPGRVPLNVVYLNTLSSTVVKQQFVAALLTRLYAWMLGAPPGDGGPRLLLMLDEVGPYMPPSREPPSKEILKRIFQEGRKYGVSGLFCTQSFTNVDYKVLAQANTLAVGKLGSAQDRRRAAEIDPRVGSQLERLAGRGHAFVLQAPEGLEKAPVVLSPRPLLTEHGPPWNEDELARRLAGRGG